MLVALFYLNAADVCTHNLHGYLAEFLVEGHNKYRYYRVGGEEEVVHMEQLVEEVVVEGVVLEQVNILEEEWEVDKENS